MTPRRGLAPRRDPGEPVSSRSSRPWCLLRARAAAPLLAGALAFTGGPGAARAQDVEEILSYDVSIDVRAGGIMTVTEEIVVRSLGREVRRGIYRDFPTSFPRAAGLGRIEAPFAVRSVLRDGAAEPYELSAIGGPFGRGGVRVRIGDPDVLLEPGVHTYAITYGTERWIAFGEEEDRLYWNVTGNGWSLPIRSASARVRVEGLDAPPRLESWTGPESSTASAAEHAWSSGGREAFFGTTRDLAPGEGLTIQVSFPSGLLEPPAAERREAWFRMDWGGYVDAGYLVLLMIAVYLLMWRRVGMDPAGGPTRLRDEPPEGFSPAALGYLGARGYESRQLTAALVSMATKGALRIERERTGWRLHRVDGTAHLSAEERAVFDELFGARDEVEVTQANHRTLRQAVKRLRSTLSTQLEKQYFENNRRWFAVGAAVSLVGFGVLAWRWRFAIELPALFLGVWLTAWTAGLATMWIRTGSLLRHARRAGGRAEWVGGGLLLVFSLPFLAAELFALGLLLVMVPSHLVLAALAVGAVNMAFYHLLERPTLRGRGVLDALDGFRAHLAGAQPARGLVPAASAGLFDRFLPHAIALGLESSWARGFDEVLVAPAFSTERGSYRPWYHHHGTDDRFDSDTFASSLGAGLASSLSAASSPPSSGGSGGGGSSGGGGGGGGGGGW